jgi:tellurite resistance protein TerC
MRFARKHLRVTHELHEARFFVKRGGLRYATPLFLVLLVIEFTDVLFAFDSVPAVLGISQDAFIIYSSNIFAILGLRALYFLIAGVMGRLRYLDFGLAVVLIFIGLKMILDRWIHVPTLASLGVITVILVGVTAASLLRPAPEPDETAPPEEDLP